MRAVSGSGRSSAYGLCSPLAWPCVSGMAMRRGSRSVLSFNVAVVRGVIHTLSPLRGAAGRRLAVEPQCDGFDRRLEAASHEVERHRRRPFRTQLHRLRRQRGKVDEARPARRCAFAVSASASYSHWLQRYVPALFETYPGTPAAVHAATISSSGSVVRARVRSAGLHGIVLAHRARRVGDRRNPARSARRARARATGGPVRSRCRSRPRAAARGARRRCDRAACGSRREDPHGDRSSADDPAFETARRAVRWGSRYGVRTARNRSAKRAGTRTAVFL